MADERTYTVPLRKGFSQKPRYKRTKHAVSTLRAFLSRHMKVPETSVKIGQHLNEFLWERGIRNPPPRVRVTAKREQELVLVELEGKTYASSVKPAAAQEQPEGLKEKLQAAIGKKETPPEEPAAQSK